LRQQSRPPLGFHVRQSSERGLSFDEVARFQRGRELSERQGGLHARQDPPRFRANQGVPVGQFSWALIMSKEYLWQFLLREAMADQAMQLLSELDFLLLLEQFFDRAIYYGVSAYDAAARREAA